LTDISHQTESPAPPLPAYSRILFGPYGLRAGWSLLIAVVLFPLCTAAINSILRATHLITNPHQLAHSPGPLYVFVTETAAFLAVALITWIMSRIEGRPISVYGLGGTRKLRYLVLGALVGLIAISILVFVLLKAGLLIIDRHLLFGSQALLYAVLWIPGFLAIGFFEEYLFRGYLQYTLARGFAGIAERLSLSNPRAVGFWTAAFLVSFGFGAVHSSNPGESPIGLLCAALASLVFCLSLWRTGSLWWAVGMHAAWDYGQSFLYGVGDSGIFVSPRLLETHPTGSPLLSGGTTGPEGSVFSLLVLAAIAVLIQITRYGPEQTYATRMPPTPVKPPLVPTETASPTNQAG